MNEKGFSLIELIIVMAIMVVLGGVIMPQLLKHYNNSRVATDVTNARELADALNVAIADLEGEPIPVYIQGKGGTAINGVDGILQLPYCKKDQDGVWEIKTSDQGVSEIILLGCVIYPEVAGGNQYYNTYYK